jgi:aminopeptidase N
MREGHAPVVVHRADYAPPPYTITAVELSFDLDPAKTIVTSRMQCQRSAGTAPGTPLKLHGEALTLLRVLADGQSVSFRHEDGALVIDQPPAAESFTLDIRNTCAPEKNRELSGLYTSGAGFYTQCEAEGFRRISYFLDRPDVMAVYTVTLRADAEKYPVLLAGGNLVEQGALEGGRHFAKWHDPFPKPSYLFALVAADLVAREQRIVARSGREHLLQIYVKRGDLDKTGHAMASLLASIAWDEARFGLSLDLDRFMIVAVEDFNMGAMENKGLNLFNTKYVLASPATATDGDYADIESVVAHEYFHNWTGNRVTCRDWFQLSLKEGLTVFRDQQFSMDMAGSASARAVQRIEAVRGLRAFQFPEDAGAMAHPVRPDSYAAIDNFYTPTVYEKGAEVVQMMHGLVGEAGFARGMKLYFERHDGQAVTCDDFAAAIADANPASLLAAHLVAFKRWYSQSGTPRLRARGQYDAAVRSYALTLSQHCPPTPGQMLKEPFVIPVRMALFAASGRPLSDERLLVLHEAEQTFHFSLIDEAPVVSLLRGFSAPVKLDDGASEADLLLLLAHDSDAFNRWEAGQRLLQSRLLAAVREGRAVVLDAPLAGALRSVLQHPTLDAALKAQILTPPPESVIADALDSVDPQAIHRARASLLAQLATALQPQWLAAFEQQPGHEAYSPRGSQPGRRALANLALAMLCLNAASQGDEVWPGRAYQRVKSAGNMTDRLGALSALLDSQAPQAPLASAALEHFHARVRHDVLGLDKWFSQQARAAEPLGSAAGTSFERARALVRHADFSLDNPNRARSLLIGLCMHNPAAFHRPDAAGYVFWAEQVLALDEINPQLAARLARALDRWPALVEPYRGAAREALQRVAERNALSDDVREIVEKALQAGAA